MMKMHNDSRLTNKKRESKSRAFGTKADYRIIYKNGIHRWVHTSLGCHTSLVFPGILSYGLDEEKIGYVARDQ